MRTPENQSIFPVSPMQQGMLFDYLTADTLELDVPQVVGLLHESVEISDFERAWERIVARYPPFRTFFRWEGLAEPVGVVDPTVKIPLAFLNWGGVPESEQSEKLTEFLDSDRHRGFDLSKPPLARLTLIDLGRTCYAFVWTLHHVLMDAASFPALLKEVFGFYEAVRAGSDAPLAPPDLSSSYYAGADRGQDKAEQEAFWSRLLGGFTAPTPLPSMRATNSHNGTWNRRGEKKARLSEETTAALRRLAFSHKVTLNILLQAAWTILLNRYSGEEDIVFGAVRRVPSRSEAEVAPGVGLFINTLPMRIHLDGSVTLANLFRQLRDQHLAIRPHKHTRLVDVQRWSAIPAAMGLFKTIVVFNRDSLEQKLKAQGGNWRNRKFRLFESLSRFPLGLYAYADSSLLVKLVYDRSQCDDMDMDRSLQYLQCLLSRMVQNPHATVQSLTMLTSDENQLLNGWNATRRPVLAGRCIHQLVEEQVDRTPDAVAVISANQKVTYRELNRRANSLARYLQDLGVGPEVIVGIYLTRSVEMVVSVLAVLKAGAAYLPLDPAYPRARLAFMLQDAQVKIVLTEAQIAGSLPGDLSGIVHVDQHRLGITQPEAVPLPSGALPENLAYLIYTSGSTGNPKGVMVEHRNVVNFFRAMDESLNHGAGGVWLAVTSLSFDISVLELMWTLTKGFTVVIYPGSSASEEPFQLAEYLRRHQVTHIQCTPSMVRMMTMDEGCRIGLASLRLLLIGGEPFPFDLAQELRALTQTEMINMYGPTETTIWSSTYSIPSEDLETLNSGPVIPLGRPVANTTFHVLDRHLQPVPPGVAGELFIGGAGVARGYLNRQSMTAERFLVDHFDPDAGARLYRTGDLVRYGTDGCLQFLGRCDHQVKIRGHRIEVGEIEQQMKRHPEIDQAAVLPYDYAPDDKRLRAFAVKSLGAQLSAHELRQHLGESLPEYMIPSEFHFVKSLPLTPNKKLDRKALTELRPLPSVSQVEATQFSDNLEAVVARIWEEVLGPRVLARDANFFDLGGNSFLAMKAHYRLCEVMDRQISLTDIFKYPTVRLLAEYLSRKTANDRMVQKGTELGLARRNALGRMSRIGHREARKDLTS